MTNTNKTLNLNVYNNHDPKGFQVASVLISGEQDAVLLNAQFTLPDAEQLVEQIRASGKTLKTVFITHGDPDYYFGLGVIKAAFPEAELLTTPAVLKHIQETADNKVVTWGERMGDLVPKSVTYPDAFTGDHLTLEGQTLSIVHGIGTSADKMFFHIPSIKAVVGGVMVFGNMHVWTADTPTVEERQDWIKSLDAIIALAPEVVIPGHFQADAPQNLGSVKHTRDYLNAFEAELSKATGSEQLITAMKNIYPSLGLGIALDIGAKVNTGEMTW